MCQTLLYSIYCIHRTWKEVVGQGDVVNRGVCCRSLLVLLGPTIKGPVKQIKLWIGFSCWSGQLDPHLIVKSVSIKKKLLSFIGIEPFKVQNNVLYLFFSIFRSRVELIRVGVKMNEYPQHSLYEKGFKTGDFFYLLIKDTFSFALFSKGFNLLITILCAFKTYPTSIEIPRIQFFKDFYHILRYSFIDKMSRKKCYSVLLCGRGLVWFGLVLVREGLVWFKPGT